MASIIVEREGKKGGEMVVGVTTDPRLVRPCIRVAGTLEFLGCQWLAGGLWGRGIGLGVGLLARREVEVWTMRRLQLCLGGNKPGLMIGRERCSTEA